MTLFEAYNNTLHPIALSDEMTPEEQTRRKKINTTRRKAAAILVEEFLDNKYLKRLNSKLKNKEQEQNQNLDIIEDLIQDLLFSWTQRRHVNPCHNEKHVKNLFIRGVINRYFSFLKKKENTFFKQNEIKSESTFDICRIPDNKRSILEQLQVKEDLVECKKRIEQVRSELRSDARKQFDRTYQQICLLERGDLTREDLIYDEIVFKKKKSKKECFDGHVVIWKKVLLHLECAIPEDVKNYRTEINKILKKYKGDLAWCVLKNVRFEKKCISISKNLEDIFRLLRPIELERKRAKDRYQKRFSRTQQRLSKTMLKN